jgi:hypothetical protein
MNVKKNDLLKFQSEPCILENELQQSLQNIFFNILNHLKS